MHGGAWEGRERDGSIQQVAKSRLEQAGQDQRVACCVAASHARISTARALPVPLTQPPSTLHLPSAEQRHTGGR